MDAHSCLDSSLSPAEPVIDLYQYQAGQQIVLESPFSPGDHLYFRITATFSGNYGKGFSKSCVTSGILSGVSLPPELQDKQVVAKFFDSQRASGLRQVRGCSIDPSRTKKDLQNALTHDRLFSFIDICNQTVDISSVIHPAAKEVLNETFGQTRVPRRDLIEVALAEHSVGDIFTDAGLIPAMSREEREIFIWYEVHQDFLYEVHAFEALKKHNLSFIPSYYGCAQVMYDDDGGNPDVRSILKTPVVLMEMIDGNTYCGLEHIIKETRSLDPIAYREAFPDIPHDVEHFRSVALYLQQALHTLWDLGLEHTDLHGDNFIIRSHSKDCFSVVLLDISAVRSIHPESTDEITSQEVSLPWHWPTTLQQRVLNSDVGRFDSEDIVINLINRLAYRITSQPGRLIPELARFPEFQQRNTAIVWHLLVEDVRMGGRRARLGPSSIMVIMRATTLILTVALEHLASHIWAVCGLELLIYLLSHRAHCSRSQTATVIATAGRLVAALEIFKVYQGPSFQAINDVSNGRSREFSPIDSGYGSLEEAISVSRNFTEDEESSDRSETSEERSDSNTFCYNAIDSAEVLNVMRYVRDHEIVKQECWKVGVRSDIEVTTYLYETCRYLNGSAGFMVNETGHLASLVVDRMIANADQF